MSKGCKMLPRKIFKELEKQMKDRKISFLIGPRQVGKTTLLKALFEEAAKTNNCIFIDLDIITNYEKVSTFENLVNTLKLNGYKENQKTFTYLFLDEFQRYPKLALIMKNVYDNLTNVKIYASGSSSILIKDQVQESLAGRKKINEIYPLDFEEVLWFKGNKKLIEAFINSRKLNGDELNKVLKELNELLKEFLIFGGYPEVVLKEKKEEKIGVLESIFDLYVKKDLVDYMKIEKILNMKKLIEVLAVNNAQKIKYEEISHATSLSFLEIKEYIEILKETYLIQILKPFYTNKNKELVKIPKVYFMDNGVRNYFIKNFNELSLRNDAGFLFESFIIMELLKKKVKELKFWQGKNGEEVDIIIDNISYQIPIEVKFKSNLKNEDFSGINTYLKEYPKTKKTYLVNLSAQKTIKKIHLLLPYCINKVKA
ncbi:ATP-binding protein [Candidatus Woesearchaeota archaeon]|nr:ATP-binding protein [Candidatus Woesearchaeota archaeon]